MARLALLDWLGSAAARGGGDKNLQSSYIPKPVTSQGMVEITKKIGFYWFDIVRLTSQEIVLV